MGMRDSQATLREITSLLRDLGAGRKPAADDLLALVYEDLHALAQGQIARRGARQTLQATDLVHEAWLRLVANGAPEFESRVHFFGAAANAMRNLMVEAARRKASRKRDAALKQDLPEELPGIEPAVDLGDVLAVHEALAELEGIDERAARIVTLRFFGGLSLPEAAEVVGTSLATAERDWRFARAYLQHRMRGHGGTGDHA
jgi:RNA polymerase sigma factor (TIGR02999 family)